MLNIYFGDMPEAVYDEIYSTYEWYCRQSRERL